MVTHVIVYILHGYTYYSVDITWLHILA